MKKHFLFFILMLLSCIPVLAGPLEKGFEALKVFNYFEAKELFGRSMKNHPAGAAFGLSTIYYRNDNPFSNVDSAYKYIQLSEKHFKLSDPKEREALLKVSVTLESINELKEKITLLAFEKSKTENTVESFDWFIKNFTAPAYKKEALKLRNKLAFEIAKKTNTTQGFKDFISKYPEAENIKEARWLYDLTLFNSITNPNTLETYESFVKQFPKSPYRMQAEDSLYVFSTKNETIAEYRTFIKKYPSNHNVKKAWEMIYRLSTSGSDPSSYANFLFDFPDFPDKPRVKTDSELARTSLFLIQQEGKWGFMDSLGHVRIACQYDWADDFSEGTAAVILNDAAGYIGKSGTVTIPFVFDEANAFHGGFAIVKKNGKFGLLHKTGKQVLPLEFDDISYDEKSAGEKILRTLKEGIYRFYDSKGGLLLDGKTSLPADRPEKVGDFFSGRAYFIQADKYGFINKTGEKVIAAAYDWAENFHNGLARVKLNEKSGLIDTIGKIVLPAEYDNIDNFSEDLALIAKDKKFGYINRKGETVIPIKYDYSSEISATNGFHNGLAKIELNKKRGLVDKTGKIIISCEYEDLRNFSEELCAVKKGKWGYIDKNKKQKINFQFEYAWDFAGGLARVKIKGKTGYINQRGEAVIPAIYEEATDFKNQVAIVILAGKKGAIDHTGKVIVPCEMDECTEAGKGMLKLEKNGKTAYYNLPLQKQVWSETGF